MRKLLVSIGLTLGLYAATFTQKLEHELNNLSSTQHTYLRLTYVKAKQFDLQNTMSAILWQESDFGRVLVNLKSYDCGAFQVNAKTLAKSDWKQNVVCTRLIKDYDFSFSVALERFKYFYNYWLSKGHNTKVAWKRAVCSYKAGFKWKNGLGYYKKIVIRIKLINAYMTEKGYK